MGWKGATAGRPPVRVGTARPEPCRHEGDRAGYAELGSCRRQFGDRTRRGLFEELRVRAHGEGDVRLGPEQVVRERGRGAAREIALDLRPGRVVLVEGPERGE